jgi:hypothetical protein
VSLFAYRRFSHNGTAFLHRCITFRAIGAVMMTAKQWFAVVAVYLLASFISLHAQDPKSAGVDKQEQAASMLASARAQASKFEPAAQAAILYLIGRALSKENPAQAKKDLEQAFDLARRAGRDQIPGWEGLAVTIVMQTTTVSPEYVEANLPTEAAFREAALARIVEHKLANNQFPRAIELQKQMTSEPGAYVAARQILQKLPKSSEAERADLFANLLLLYRKTTHRNSTIGYPEDLSTVIVRFWQELPRDLVKEGVEEVLKQAAEKTPANAEIIAASSPAGTITFSSAAEFRAFQMLPVLKVIDPARAEALEKESQKLREMSAKYPEGQQSLDPTLRSTALNEGEVRRVRYAISPQAGQAYEAAAGLEANRQTQRIEAELQDDPSAAIATAASIPDPYERGATLIRIATALAENHPELAAKALNRLFDASTLRPIRNSGHFISAASIMLQLGRPDDARRLLAAAVAEVCKAYDGDHDPDDPNLVLKLFWGSTHGWRDSIAVAARISDQDALGIIKDIPDEEIQAIARVMLAGIWLDIPVWRGTSPMVSKKRKT